MTTAQIKIRGRHFHITIDGHSNFNPGNDIVCSACSILACALSESLAQEKERGTLAALVTYDGYPNDGLVLIDATASIFTRRRIALIVRTVFLGYLLLEKTYPDNVRVIQDIR